MSGVHQAPAQQRNSRPKRFSAAEFIEEVVDTASFRSWDSLPVQPEVGAVYANELAAARLRSGSDEAVVTGEGLVDGTRIALIASEFGFLAGSVGAAAARRIITAVERATAAGLPILASPASGGTRMQEGTRAFLSLVEITSALERHKAAGHLYLVYLRHPTTGGAMASWGSRGQITFAEPGALLGFLGPRVYEALHGEPFPAGVQSAENLHRHGLVDAVVPVEQLKEHLTAVLGYTDGPNTAILLREPPFFGRDGEHPHASKHGEESVAGPCAQAVGALGEQAVAGPYAWECVSRSRRPGRPGSGALLHHAATEVVLLGEASGDGLTIALARFGVVRCVVVAQDKVAQKAGQLIGPASLRRARRGMALAAELGLPLLTVIDTPGAELSAAAEEGGLAGEIARCIAAMAALAVPTVSLILGEGAGGAAIALLPADRLVCAQNGWLAPLPPEGASAIVHRHTGQAQELARKLGIRAVDLHAQGIADLIVRESPDAAEEAVEFCLRMGTALEEALGHAMAAEGSPSERLRNRVGKYSVAAVR